MNFNEFKSAAFWQQERNRKEAEERRDNFAGALVATVMFTLFPFLYCIASILDG